MNANLSEAAFTTTYAQQHADVRIHSVILQKISLQALNEVKMQFTMLSRFLTLLLLSTSAFALRPFRGSEIIRTLNSLSLIYIDLTVSSRSARCLPSLTPKPQYLIPNPSSLIERWSRVTDIEFAYENGTYAAVPWKPFNHSSQYDIQAAHHNVCPNAISRRP